MKLAVFDVEGTIFKIHEIEGHEHASYIWTRVADELGDGARSEEIQSQKNWRNNEYGLKNSGTAYMKWVIDTILIHRKYGLTASQFNRIIDEAPYVDGIRRFFSLLNRDEYIPVLISGGIQNLNAKACCELSIERENSYAACEYYFNEKGEIDWDLRFVNSCNFWGKEEIVKILLRKYGLGKKDWIFIGDGVNDKAVASSAPIFIEIKTLGGLEKAANYSFRNFDDLLSCSTLREETDLWKSSVDDKKSPNRCINREANFNPETIKNTATEYVKMQIGNIDFEALYTRAQMRIWNDSSKSRSVEIFNRKISGIEELLIAGQTTFLFHTQFLQAKSLAFSNLQSFCNAVEAMMTLTIILLSDKEHLLKYIEEQPINYSSPNHSIERATNSSLKMILDDYEHLRNPAAHTYQAVTSDAALSFVLRTYESIQRMELLIHENVGRI